MQYQPPRLMQHSVYTPLLIALVALVGFLMFQTVELVSGRRALTQAREGQTAPMGESDRMRRQLNALATKTVELAQKGDPDAKAIIDDFAKRGLTFVPPKAPATSP